MSTPVMVVMVSHSFTHLFHRLIYLFIYYSTHSLIFIACYMKSTMSKETTLSGSYETVSVTTFFVWSDYIFYLGDL